MGPLILKHGQIDGSRKVSVKACLSNQLALSTHVVTAQGRQNSSKQSLLSASRHEGDGFIPFATCRLHMELL